MSWVSWLALILALVSLVISIINYRKSLDRLREVEDTNRRVEAALREFPIKGSTNEA